MIVVADTSPLNYLIQIECVGLLPQLYQRIMVPDGVLRELGHAGSPAPVKAWLSHIPDWLEVQPLISPPEADLMFLDWGEREAIQLAQEQHADLLLVDERKARREATRRGLRVTGTLGVLLTAGELKLINPMLAYRRLLAETTFRASAALEAKFLR